MHAQDNLITLGIISFSVVIILVCFLFRKHLPKWGYRLGIFIGIMPVLLVLFVIYKDHSFARKHEALKEAGILQNEAIEVVEKIQLSNKAYISCYKCEDRKNEIQSILTNELDSAIGKITPPYKTRFVWAVLRVSSLDMEFQSEKAAKLLKSVYDENRLLVQELWTPEPPETQRNICWRLLKLYPKDSDDLKSVSQLCSSGGFEY